jgi:hypothetical protein
MPATSAGMTCKMGFKMKTLLTIIGAALLAMGVLWACQGAGIIKWPAESFMISQSQWIYYGAITAVIGLFILIFARR